MAFAAAGQAGFSSGAALGGSPFAGILDGLTKGQKLALLGEQTKTLAMRSEMMEKFLSGGFGKKKTGEPSDGSPYSPGKAGGEALGASGATATDAFIGPPSKDPEMEAAEQAVLEATDSGDAIARVTAEDGLNRLVAQREEAARAQASMHAAIGPRALEDHFGLTPNMQSLMTPEEWQQALDAVPDEVMSETLTLEAKLNPAKFERHVRGAAAIAAGNDGTSPLWFNSQSPEGLDGDGINAFADPSLDAYFSNPLDDISSAVRRARDPLLQQALPIPPGTLPPGILKSFPYLQQLMGDDQPLTTLGGIQQLSALNAGSTRKY
jgi:hypothetical protein